MSGLREDCKNLIASKCAVLLNLFPLNPPLDCCVRSLRRSLWCRFHAFVCARHEDHSRYRNRGAVPKPGSREVAEIGRGRTPSRLK